MIQRKQSIYLFLVSLICLAMTFTDINLYKGKALTNDGISIDYKINTNTSTLGFASPVTISKFEIPISITLVALLSIASIFFYGNLNRQLTLVTSNFGAITIVLINVYLIKGRIGGTNGITFQDLGINWSIVLLLGVLILNFLAARGIKKDLDLLASADRLR
jgi:hypothetical protein